MPRWKSEIDLSKKGLTLLDTVFYSEDMDANMVRNSLIDHDGYPISIIVVANESR